MSDDSELADKLSPEDKEAILAVVDEQLAWLEDAAAAETSELTEALAKVEEVAQPIMAKLYQNKAGADEL